MSLLIYKQQLLSQYNRYFRLLKIGSLSTTETIKKHFQAAHVYLRILEYYNNIDPTQDIEIPVIPLEKVKLQLEKSIYSLATKYYV